MLFGDIQADYYNKRIIFRQMMFFYQLLIQQTNIQH